MQAYHDTLGGLLFADRIDRGGGGAADASSGAAAGQLLYAEFLESLAALSVYRFPDPYQPLVPKVQDFVTKILLKRAKMTKTVSG